MSLVTHLLDQELRVAKYMAERRAKIVKQVGRKFMLNGILDLFR